MSFLEFDKNQLGNLEYSLGREMLSTDRSGGYMGTTIVCCNTRKYHGLFVAPSIDPADDRNYVMLSSLDETILQQGKEFNLAIHRYPGVFEPRGHKYIADFVYTPCPRLTYRVGGVELVKEMLWVHSRTRLLIRYTLTEARSETMLRLRPLLAFRDSHSLSRANMQAQGRATMVEGGIKCRLYDNFPWLTMQTDTAAEFIGAPQWYYNFEYPQEADRGYDFREDLLTPGYFEMPVKKGQSVIFACSFEQLDPRSLAGIFEDEIARRTRKDDFYSCLRHSARQFIARRNGRTEVIAGFPWFGRWGRDTFIALPGIALSSGDVASCREVLDTMVSEMKEGFFPNMGTAYNSVDAPLWFFHTIQQLEEHTDAADIWRTYGKAMKAILTSFRNGIVDGIGMKDNGLIWASVPGKALTWMDAVVNGVPVTGRDGYQVEINALWYNALCYCMRVAGENGEVEFVRDWAELPEKIEKSFREIFYTREGFLADFHDGTNQNLFIRPNQIIACALPYSPVDQDTIITVIETVKKHLLTPKGLRTLSPRNPQYEGRYGGDQPTRDRQYHQGTVWPWLLEFYVGANYRIYGKDFISTADEILSAFEEDMSSYGIGSIPEIYDGDPPHYQRGAISQAWSVGALLRIRQMTDQYIMALTENTEGSLPGDEPEEKTVVRKAVTNNVKLATGIIAGSLLAAGTVAGIRNNLKKKKR